MRRAVYITLLGSLLGFMGFWVAQAQSSVEIATVDKVGWWTRRPAAQPTGNGTVEVAAGVQGDESVAALRILITGSITKATVVLAETSAPLSPLTPGKLRVCTTDTPWLAADGGPYADAPVPNCGSAVELTRTADASGAASWAGDVTSMVAGVRSEVSLMVVPSPDSAALIPPTYFMALTARIAAEGTSDVAPTTTPVTQASAPTGGGSSGPRVTVATGTAASPVTTAPVATAPAAGAGTQPQRFAVVSAKKVPKPWGKLVWPLLPLSALFGFVYTYGQKYLEHRNSIAS
jgi:hypothetical protein